MHLRMPETNINLFVCPRTNRLCVELRRLAVGFGYADALPVRLGSSYFRADGAEVATERGQNVADARATMLTVVMIVVGCA